MSSGEFKDEIDRQKAAFDALDKPMQNALLEDRGRMMRRSSPYLTFTSARAKREKNKAFMKDAKAVKLGPDD